MRMNATETGNGLPVGPAEIAQAQNTLSAALRMNAMIGLKLAQLDQLRSRAVSVTQRLDGLSRGTGYGDRVGEAAAKLADQEAELLEDYHRLLDQQFAIRGYIQALPDPLWQAVMEMRYLQGTAFPMIAARLAYDERQIYRFHKKALMHVALQMAQETEQ